jgi:hypothetical protein
MSDDGGAAISGAAAAQNIVGGFVNMVDGLGSIGDIGKALKGGGAAEAAEGVLGLAVAAATAAAQTAIARAAGLSGLEEGIDESAGGLNSGQSTILEGYVKPAMQAVISADPEDFDSGSLVAAGISSHYAADQALSDVIEAGADAAEDARDEAMEATQEASLAE